MGRGWPSGRVRGCSVVLGDFVLAGFRVINPTVFHVRHAVGVFENAIVVRDDDDAAIRLGGDVLQNLHHLLAVLAIERRRRLVANDQLRVMHQRPRDGHALLLSAGKHVRPMMHPLAEPDRLQHLRRFLLGDGSGRALDTQRHAHVLDAIQRRDQIVLLENETDVRRAKLRAGLLVQAVERRIEHLHLAAIRAERAGDDAEQRRLAAPGRADQHEQLAHARLEVHFLEHLGAALALAESFVHPAGFDCDIFHNSNSVVRYACCFSSGLENRK